MNVNYVEKIGYIDSSNVDSEFIQWMAENCSQVDLPPSWNVAYLFDDDQFTDLPEELLPEHDKVEMVLKRFNCKFVVFV